MKDVLILGSGAGGSTLALALARKGVDVLVLEKGPDWRPEDFPEDEVENYFRGFFVPPLAEDPHILVHRDLAAPRPTHLGWIALGTGGGTAHMGGYMSRFHPGDFSLGGRSGPFAELADWPYTYEDLERFYSQAEWELGVSGVAGSDPMEGRRSRPFPLPPLVANALAGPFDEACARLGLSAFPTPLAINSRPYGGRPACEYCSRCGGYGCRKGARGTAREALLSRALSTGCCEIRTHAMVREITTTATGRASGCVYIDADGIEQRVAARAVCVCCSAVESARLLLLSASPLFPDGLGNGNGLVGRHLQFHGSSAGRGVFRTGDSPLPFSDRNPFLLRSVSDYYWLPDGVSDLAKGGLLIFQCSQHQPILRAKTIAAQGQPALWGMALKERLSRAGRDDTDVIGFEVQHDFLPNPGTYVELDPEVKDVWGLPVARIHLEESEHQRAVGRWLVERGLEILREMGAETVEAVSEGDTAPYLVAGTCRAGSDPARSVLDGTCRSHEVPNLFVVDGSFMPTASGVPPTLTIVANAFRTAEHILELARRGDLSAA